VELKRRREELAQFHEWTDLEFSLDSNEGDQNGYGSRGSNATVKKTLFNII
jgi:hypothetical protein